MNKKSGATVIELLITLFCFGMVCASIALFIFVVGLGVKGCHKIQEDGVKGLVETVWEGTNATQNVNE